MPRRCGASRARRPRCSRISTSGRPTRSARLSTFSGGNQQKVVLAKWLRGPASSSSSEPTAVVDIGAKLEIYKLVRALCEARHRCRPGQL